MLFAPSPGDPKLSLHQESRRTPPRPCFGGAGRAARQLPFSPVAVLVIITWVIRSWPQSSLTRPYNPHVPKHANSTHFYIAPAWRSQMTMYNIHRGSSEISQKGWIFMLLACLAGIGRDFGWVDGGATCRKGQPSCFIPRTYVVR
jgi:hypothetical protein